MKGERKNQMGEMFRLTHPAEALRLLLDAVRSCEQASREESVALENSLGRTVSGDIFSAQNLPDFIRSTMDGYAVRAADTFGASEALPAYLRVIGEVTMGVPPSVRISEGTCVVVHTGGMLPEGADSVVMMENTQSSRDGEIEVVSPAAPGENVIQVGEDVKVGDRILRAGHTLRPQDIGGLAALGMTEIVAVKRPIIAVISTGDEVVPPGTMTKPGQVRDINSYSLSSLIEESGGQPLPVGIVPDNQAALLKAAEEALRSADALVISAGSSVSARDITVKVIQDLGKPGILVHGVSIRPGKPTILADCSKKPVIGLPGNPVSAFISAALFLKPLINEFLKKATSLEDSFTSVSGSTLLRENKRVRAALLKNVSSSSGREDYIPVRLFRSGKEKIMADPVFGKSNLIYTLIHSIGLICVPFDEDGLHAGEEVEVILF